MIEAGECEGAGWRRSGPEARAVLTRLSVAAVIVAGALWLAWDRLGGLDLSEIGRLLRAAPAEGVLAALVLTAVSHAAVACYDPVALRRVGLDVPFRRALAGGFSATTLGQALGFGLLVGAAARWRLYRRDGVGPGAAAAVTGLVAAGFFTGTAVLLCAMALLHPAPLARLGGFAEPSVSAAGAAALALCAALLIRRGRARRTITLGGMRLSAPDWRWVALCAVLAGVDLGAAAGALWALTPVEAAPPFATLFVVYVGALLLGQASGAPGGIGAFEAALLVGLPDAPAEALIAAAIAYRAVYLAPPSLLAGWIVVRARPAAPATAGGPPPAALRGAARCARPERELAFLGDKRFHVSPDSEAFLMFGARGRDRVLMGDPYGPREAWGPLVDRFAERCRREGARLSVYKAEDAAFWAGRGLRLQPLGEEASVDVAGFDLKASSRRELRRKIGQARKAGVTILRHAPGAAPLPRLAAVARMWREAKAGREMTFSMGWFDVAFLSRHAVFEARRGEETLGFLSVWASGDGSEHMIDLMRLVPGGPHGVMHALTAAAIEAAGAAGAARFNLCMAPLSGLERIAPVTPLSRVGAAICGRTAAGRGLQGLRRFKEAFRPDWRPRYLVAAGPLSGALALLAVRGLVNREPPEIDVEGLQAAQAFLDADALADAPAAAAPAAAMRVAAA
ncbi:bifunctional lysylphosphatidylglycerol flippase/synthetase MprF [Rubrimonas cliftonensis]|uniref:Phosphatidylglycerol lysyltransferase n=1 Tax=Rubrimonas cliftonensis TaxID=89524 RepID=A0A1H4DBD3_9RHOB|nr:phosphatidylglycerol lysyltransferase domain-containing protein [Rubrimonas cliftonensis]SEA69826.1 phosphatidylglycerol lysyltransferase [Rubrimonas cliftonensis]